MLVQPKLHSETLSWGEKKKERDAKTTLFGVCEMAQQGEALAAKLVTGHGGRRDQAHESYLPTFILGPRQGDEGHFRLHQFPRASHYCTRILQNPKHSGPGILERRHSTCLNN